MGLLRKLVEDHFVGLRELELDVRDTVDETAQALGDQVLYFEDFNCDRKYLGRGSPASDLLYRRRGLEQGSSSCSCNGLLSSPRVL